MSDADIPEIPNGAMPPWAVMGVQLLETLLQRLKNDDPGGPPEGHPPARPPRGAAQARPEGRLERTCRVLSRRNERVSRALGACRCWGLSADCPRCGGQGRPGALDVDPEAFAEVVLPLLQAQPELILRHFTRTVEVVPSSEPEEEESDARQ